MEPLRPGLKINAEKISDKSILLKVDTTYIIQVGKRKFAKISIINKS